MVYASSCAILIVNCSKTFESTMYIYVVVVFDTQHEYDVLNFDGLYKIYLSICHIESVFHSFSFGLAVLCKKKLPKLKVEKETKEIVKTDNVTAKLYVLFLILRRVVT